MGMTMGAHAMVHRLEAAEDSLYVHVDRTRPACVSWVEHRCAARWVEMLQLLVGGDVTPLTLRLMVFPFHSESPSGSSWSKPRR